MLHTERVRAHPGQTSSTVSRRGVNWLDFIVILIMVWFAFTGLTTGLVREVVALLASTIGVVLAGRYYARLADDIAIVHTGATANRLVAFVAIFAACVLAGQLAGLALKGFVSTLHLSWLDRAGGLAFGILKGAVIVEALLIGMANFPAAVWMAKALDTSLLAPVFLSGVPWLLHLLPASFRIGVAAF
jgi:membrane protein required for colicin V production